MNYTEEDKYSKKLKQAGFQQQLGKRQNDVIDFQRRKHICIYIYIELKRNKEIKIDSLSTIKARSRVFEKQKPGFKGIPRGGFPASSRQDWKRSKTIRVVRFRHNDLANDLLTIETRPRRRRRRCTLQQ
ncbi:uncharacterized protein LOC102655890 [Apis mellifera]|uniref:Uncharacterized protein LOC102655890 n=1 Tax=Apis mellifera TaxID=7460 RepID=A0A7M7GT57_APIME|nr:uncharacterized protein LOC102655890 [Apis mellifera]|eukprot:XP_006561718.1 uncharacterized protein LOC102655890 [Apis mellifera]